MKAFLRIFAGLVFAAMLLACSKEELTSDQHLDNAKAFLAEADSASAIVELKNSLQKDTGNSRARSLLGNTYFERGEYESAAKELTRAYEKGVDSAVVVPILAKTLMSLGEFRQLEALRLDNLDPQGRSEVQAAKGLSMLYRGELVSAQEILEAAVQNEPRSPYAEVAYARLAMANQNYDVARHRLNGIFKNAPEYAPAWNLLGDVESAERQPEKAEAAYTKALGLSRKSFDARLNRAMMRIYQNKFTQAHEDLAVLKKTAGGVTKVHPGVHFATGIVQLQSKNSKAARVSFEKASQYSDAYPLTFYYLAAIDLEEGNIEQALTNIYRFLGLVPGSVAGAKLAARMELEKQEYEKVVALLQPVVIALPEDIDSLNLLASAYLALGRSEESVELLVKVSELDPDSSQAKARLGAGYIAAGDEALGVSTLQNVASVDPSFEQADILIVLNFLRQGELDKAIEAAQKYRDRNPKSSTSYNLLGRAHLANDNESEATKAFQEAEKLNPGDPGANHGLADFALDKKKFKQARKYYERVLDKNSDHLQTKMKLAGSYALEGDEKSLFESLAAVQEAHPRAMEPRLVKARFYIAQGDLELAAPLLDGLSEEQKNHPDALATQAGFELAATRYNQAFYTLDKLLELRPKVSQYHYLKAKAYAGLGDMENFTSELKVAVELDPNHFYAKVALARLSHVTNDRQEFDRLLAELTVLAPENPDVMKLEVYSALNGGDNASAKVLLRSLYEKAPTTSNMMDLASHLEKTGDRPGGISLLQQWLAEHETDTKAREQLASLYGKNEQIDQVITQYEAILENDENNIVALNNLSWYLLETKPDDSLEYAQRAYALAPDSSSVLDTLGMALMANNKLMEARRIVDRALALAPKNADIAFHNAKLTAAEGNKKTAIKLLSKVLQNNEEFPERKNAEALEKQLQGG